MRKTHAFEIQGNSVVKRLTTLRTSTSRTKTSTSSLALEMERGCLSEIQKKYLPAIEAARERKAERERDVRERETAEAEEHKVRELLLAAQTKAKESQLERKKQMEDLEKKLEAERERANQSEAIGCRLKEKIDELDAAQTHVGEREREQRQQIAELERRLDEERERANRSEAAGSNLKERIDKFQEEVMSVRRGNVNSSSVAATTQKAAAAAAADSNASSSQASEEQQQQQQKLIAELKIKLQVEKERADRIQAARSGDIESLDRLQERISELESSSSRSSLGERSEVVKQEVEAGSAEQQVGLGDVVATTGSGSSTSSQEVSAGKKEILVRFSIQYCTRNGQSLVLIGDHPRLGKWRSSQAVRMTWSNGHLWTAEVELPCREMYFYKYAVVENGNVCWQQGSNRLLTIPEFSGVRGPLIEAHDKWDGDPVSSSVMQTTVDGGLSWPSSAEERLQHFVANTVDRLDGKRLSLPTMFGASKGSKDKEKQELFAELGEKKKDDFKG